MPDDIVLNSQRKLRVALLGIYHESNTFISEPTTLDDFRNSHFLTGEDIRREYSTAFHEIGGMLEVMSEEGIEVIPLLFAEATPGGIIARNAYEHLLQELLSAATGVRVDAFFVVPHGAGVADGVEDMDGHWLSELRRIAGPGTPIVGTLDPHANVSEAMTRATDALIAYKTNPHIDQRATGRLAAELLVRTLRGEVKPVQRLVPLPIAISIEQQNTNAEPCRDFLRLAKEIESNTAILSVSLLLGFPYSDVKDMGSAFIIVGDNIDEEEMDRIAVTLQKSVISKKDSCIGKMQTIDQLLPALFNLPKPALLLDMGDNIGGGSPGDSAYLLHAIERDGRFRSFICIFDPEAVATLQNIAIGEEYDLQFGNLNPLGEKKPFRTLVKLISRGSGKFWEPNPRHGGQVSFDMGSIAIVSTDTGNTIMLNSLRVPPFSLSQLTSFGIVPSSFDLIVAKGVNAPIAAYAPVCPTIAQVNTPGVTQADMTLFTFKNRRKPLFPFENGI